LFKFASDQQVLEIGNVKVGGQPGELPTVLIGSIFHVGHKIVEDSIQGVFNKMRAESLIKKQEEMSDKTGNPHMIDIVGVSYEAIRKYLDFVADATDAPFLINGMNSSVRIQALGHVTETGLLDRAVYTSINFTAKEDELAAIKNSKLQSAIVQTFNPYDTTKQGMHRILEGTSEKEGLLQMTSRSGVQNILILTTVLDIPSIGLAASGIQSLKNSYGLPVGAAPLGVLSQWKRANEFDIEKMVFRSALAALVQAAGANFLIYGSIGKAEAIFPACAIIDGIIAYGARSFGVKAPTKNHPLYKIF